MILNRYTPHGGSRRPAQSNPRPTKGSPLHAWNTHPLAPPRARGSQPHSSQSPTGTTCPRQRSGPTVSFADDFNGSTLDTSKWLYTLGTAYEGGPGQFGTGEIETNTSNEANASVHDGSLYITPTRKADGTWESARIESVRSDFKPAEGSVMTTTFRAAMPDVTEANGSGYWPALWMNGSPVPRRPLVLASRDGVRHRRDRVRRPVVEQRAALRLQSPVGRPVQRAQRHQRGQRPACRVRGDRSTTTASSGTAASASVTTSIALVPQRSADADRQPGDLPADVWASGTEHQGSYIIMNVAIDGAYPAAQGKLTNANTKPGVPMRVDSVSVTYSAGGSVPPPVEPPVVDPPAVESARGDAAGTDPPVTTGDFHAVPGHRRPHRPDVARRPRADHYVLLRAGVALPPAVGWTTTTAISDVGLVSKTPDIESIQAVAADGTVLEHHP